MKFFKAEPSVEKLADILFRQNEGLSKQEREGRLQKIEGIATRVHARRTKPGGLSTNREIPLKARIHA